jgi:uncharacterized Ntn-hydrolase superfamily protein
MTFSICVREPYESDSEAHVRFGVTVTTRLAGVGTLCPFAGENGTEIVVTATDTDGASGSASEPI